MRKVFIGVGHGGKDPGAVGRVKEADANLYMALSMKEELERNGYTVGISRTKNENDPLTEEIQESNAYGADIAVEVHNNAGGGDGFEVFVQTNKYAAASRKLAQCIEAEVKKTGQKSRGIKTRLNGSGTDYFGWLRQNNRPAVLCEGFFVDSADAVDYDTVAEQKAYGKAYARGVMAYFGDKPKPDNAKPTNPGAAQSFKVGDRVILNGKLETSAYGGAEGKRTYKNYQATITRIVAGAKNPYLINENLGWASSQKLKRV